MHGYQSTRSDSRGLTQLSVAGTLRKSIGERYKTYSAWVGGAWFICKSIHQRGVNRCRRGVVAEAPSSRQEMGTNRVSWQVAFSRLRIGALLRQTARAGCRSMGAKRYPRLGEVGFTGYYPASAHCVAVPGDDASPVPEVCLPSHRRNYLCPSCCSSLETPNLPRSTGQTPPLLRGFSISSRPTSDIRHLFAYLPASLHCLSFLSAWKEDRVVVLTHFLRRQLHRKHNRHGSSNGKFPPSSTIIYLVLSINTRSYRSGRPGFTSSSSSTKMPYTRQRWCPRMRTLGDSNSRHIC